MSPKNKRYITAAAAVSTMMLLTSCEGDAMDSNEPTITKSEASARLSQYVQQIVQDTLPKTARLEDHGPASELGCTDPAGKPDGRLHVSASHWIRDIDPVAYNKHFDAIKGWWTKNGWKIVNDDRPGDMFINADNPVDQFGMSIQANDKNDFSMTVSSPCVWPTGTPQPKKLEVQRREPSTTPLLAAACTVGLMTSCGARFAHCSEPRRSRAGP